MVRVNIYICDDILEEVEIIRNEVNNFALFSEREVVIKESFYQPEKLLLTFEKNNEGVNVFILDMYFEQSNESGLSIGKRIKEIDPTSYIIFVTSHEEYSFLTFKYHIGAIDFIIKDRHEKWEKQIITSLQTIEQRLTCIDQRNQSSIILETSNEVKVFALDEILFFEYLKNQKLRVRTFNNSYTVKKKTLKSLERLLSKNFFRIHKSLLVNTKYIIAIENDGSIVTLKSGIKLPVANRRRKELKKIILENLNDDFFQYNELQ